MTTTSKPTPTSGNKIVFFGNERLATGVNTDVPVLRALIDNGYSVAAVVTNYESATSRKSRDLEIAHIAKQHDIPLLIPDKLTDIREQLVGYGAIVGVLVAYGKIVPQEIIDIFPKGIVNIHPSLLPQYRGPTPVETAILNGDLKTGVSLMMLVKEMDAGPMLTQKTVHLKGTESKQELVDMLLQLGKELLIKYLPKYIIGGIKAHNQPHPNRVTFSRKLTKDDGLIDWSKSAEQIEREVRAFIDWPKSRTTLGDTEVIITRAHVVERRTENGEQRTEPGKVFIENKRLFVVAGNDGLEIENLKPAGKTEMTADEFIRGYLRRSF